MDRDYINNHPILFRLEKYPMQTNLGYFANACLTKPYT